MKQLEPVEGGPKNGYLLRTTDARRHQILQLWAEIQALPPIDGKKPNTGLSMDYVLLLGLRELRDRLRE